MLKLELSNPWNTLLNESKRKPQAQRYMKKEKFGKKEKTAKCTYCGMPGTRINFGKEVRTLCKVCLSKLNAKHQEVQVNDSTFVRASKL